MPGAKQFRRGPVTEAKTGLEQRLLQLWNSKSAQRDQRRHLQQLAPADRIELAGIRRLGHGSASAIHSQSNEIPHLSRSYIDRNPASFFSIHLRFLISPSMASGPVPARARVAIHAKYRRSTS